MSMQLLTSRSYKRCVDAQVQRYGSFEHVPDRMMDLLAYEYDFTFKAKLNKELIDVAI